MAVHFTTQEFAARLGRVQRRLEEMGLDGLLLFAQESMFWLTGYDSFGFCFFQCLYVGADGRMALLTRSADLRQAERTSTLRDVRVWRDGADAEPAVDLATMLVSLGCRGQRLGVEFASYGLPYASGLALSAALNGLCTISEASRLVPELRVTKSEAEIAFVREAARLSDLADSAALAVIGPGADEGAILAAQHNAIFQGGGDYPANEFIIGSGGDALLCRYKSGRRRLDPDDQITLELAGSFRHYHAAAMRTVVVVTPRPLHLSYHSAARDALAACEAELRPGRTAGDVFAAHARVLDAHGLGRHRLNACGYALGAKFTPSWMDPPMFYADNPFELAADQVFFLHMILMDSESETAMCLGRTSLIGAAASEPLNVRSLDLVVKSR